MYLKGEIIAMANGSSYLSSDIGLEDRRIAARLLHLRCSLGVSVVQLAGALDISTEKLEQYEHAQVPIPASLLALASLALGVEFDYFYQESASLSLPGSKLPVYFLSSDRTPLLT